MKNSNTTRRSYHQTWITAYRAVITALTVAIGVMVGILLARTTAPSAAEVASAAAPTTFARPSSMEFVPETNSCIVGGTVMSTQWHDGSEVYPIGGMDSSDVDYTTFEFRSDEERVFTVSVNGALFADPGENLGLELHCDPATMNSAPSFGLVAIIWGGK